MQKNLLKCQISQNLKKFFVRQFFFFDHATDVFTYSESEGSGLSPPQKIIKIGVGALCRLPFWKFLGIETGSLNKIFENFKNDFDSKKCMKNED